MVVLIDRRRVKPRNFHHAFYFLQLADQQIQVPCIIYIEHDLAVEDTIIGIEGKGTHIYFQFLGDDFGDIIDQPHPIGPYHLQSGEKSDLVLRRPFRLNDAIAVVGHQLRRIRAIRPVNFNSVTHGYKTKHFISRNGGTALGQLVLHDVPVLPHQQDIFIAALWSVDFLLRRFPLSGTVMRPLPIL